MSCLYICRGETIHNGGENPKEKGNEKVSKLSFHSRFDNTQPWIQLKAIRRCIMPNYLTSLQLIIFKRCNTFFSWNQSKAMGISNVSYYSICVTLPLLGTNPRPIRDMQCHPPIEHAWFIDKDHFAKRKKSSSTNPMPHANIK